MRVVELEMLGYLNNAQYGYQAAPSVTSGLTTSFVRTNADNTTDTIKAAWARSAPAERRHRIFELSLCARRCRSEEGRLRLGVVC